LPETLLTAYITTIILFLSVWVANEGLGDKRKQATTLSSAFLCQGLFYTSLLALLTAVPRTLCNDFDTTGLSGYFYASSFTGIAKFLVLATGTFILRNSRSYVISSRRHLMEYPLILSLALLFMLFLISTNHLIGAFLALVGFSLNLYVLILFDASNSAAREAGIKYYYLSTFSSGLILYGIFLSYVITGALEFSSIELFLSALPTISSYSYTLLPVALAFLFTGLFFKLSAFPGHLWAAEVYDGSPEPVTAFFMLPVKVTVLAFVIQLLDRALSPVLSHYQPMLMVAATGSLI
jgi:NADH-quinone oxidoreductase subunit N